MKYSSVILTDKPQKAMTYEMHHVYVVNQSKIEYLVDACKRIKDKLFRVKAI